MKKNDGFIMLSRELLKSPSWMRASTHCRKLLDFLILQHLSYGGRENGNLKATYNQLVAFGISRRLIHRSISEAECYGLIRVDRGGRRGCSNEMSTFHVTFLQTFNGSFVKPTGDWRKIDIQSISDFERSKNLKSHGQKGTLAVPHHDRSQFH